ncbi:unnamed protein product [Cuscuta epithymum]|uniref:Uncharacterized protein n=1 Tax=Cuscuta epithymum TaxID=186058 RepID=A0AAV0E1I2_9ASTE|nr:unnamed protein product [Cuscuta epithymum]
MATTVLCSMIGPSAPSYPVHGSARPFPPGWRRPSYAVRPAPQRHRTRLTFSSSIPSRVATNVLCSMIGPSAPSYPAHVQLAHPLQDGDDRLVHHDRPLSAIVSSSRFGSPIPSRMATTVLCSTTGPSAPSYPAHVQLVHPFQGGDERLMQYDRPLSAIIPSSRSARPSPPGGRRPSCASRSAPSAPSCPVHGSARPFPPGWRRPSYAVRPAPQRHRTRLTFSSSIPSRVATNVLCSMIGPSTPSYPAHVQLAHPLQDGNDRLVHHDRPLSAIVSSSRFGPPIPSRMATTVLCSMTGPSAPSYPVHGSARPFPPGWRRPSYAV